MQSAARSSINYACSSRIYQLYRCQRSQVHTTSRRCSSHSEVLFYSILDPGYIIPCSVSGETARRQDVIRMAKWLNNQLTELGVETKLVDLGTHVMDGQELPLPPAILGKIGNDKSKKTVLIYGHFDVQPVCRHYVTCRDANLHRRYYLGEQIRWLGH